MSKNLKTNEDWRIQKGKGNNNSKHALNPEECSCTKAKINEYCLSCRTETKTRFDEDGTPYTSDNNTIQPKPSTIFVGGVETTNLFALPNVIARDNYILKTLSNNKAKIISKISEVY